jgi:hypothetical protein
VKGGIPLDELISAKEASIILNTDENFVNTLIKAGILPYLKLRTRKIRRFALDEFMKKYEGWDISDPYNPKKIEQ